MYKAQAKGKMNDDQWWLHRPWRQIQTNLREIDMIDIDAERVVADLKEFRATSLMINSSGIIAGYPTELPDHFQNPYLQGDSLEQIIEACHKADITVIARTDFSKVRRPIYERHPDWAYISPQGKIVDYNGDIHVCFNSDYQRKYAFDIIGETLAKLDFDGIFFNAGGYKTTDYSNNNHGICHCNNCKARFKDMFGLDLPRSEDSNDPVYRKFLIFKRETVKEREQQISDFVKNINPNIVVMNNKTYGALNRGESHTELYLPLPNWQYGGSDNTKYVKGSYAPMFGVNTSADFVSIEYRHVSISPHQHALREAQNLANGGGMCYYIIGRIDNKADKTAYESIKRLYHYHADNEDEYTHLTSKAAIALLKNEPHPRGTEKEYQGWFRMLTENHFLFDCIMKDAAANVPFEKYRIIIVHEYEQLSDALCRKLDAFAAAGGTVIAVSKAGFRNDDYERRGAPALACLGIVKYNQVESNMTAAYFKLDSKESFPRLADTELCYIHGTYVYADYEERVRKYFHLIPPHPFGPPERCYYTAETDYPGLTVHRYGKGQGIYIPWEPGKQFQSHGHTNTSSLITDILENIAGAEPLRGKMSPMVEVTLHHKDDDNTELLHLVNASGHFGLTYYAPVTMHHLEVCIPYDGLPQSVRSLVTGKPYEFETNDDGSLLIRVPCLELMEAIKIS